MPKRILAVEDDPDILFIVEHILTEEGYEVHTSPDGKNITRHVEEIKPDLILMDIRLPNADGRELCKNIRFENGAAPIILTSAHVDYSKGVKEGCANYCIAKSFDIEELLKRIEQHLAA